MDQENEGQVVIEENVIEVTSLTDEEVALNWAVVNKILNDSMEKLFKDGFTSMEAIQLIDCDDLAKTKIPRGQQKLILASVKKLLSLKPTKDRAEASAPAQKDSGSVELTSRPRNRPLREQRHEQRGQRMRISRPLTANRSAPETGTRRSKMAAPRV